MIKITANVIIKKVNNYYIISRDTLAIIEKVLILGINELVIIDII